MATNDEMNNQFYENRKRLVPSTDTEGDCLHLHNKPSKRLQKDESHIVKKFSNVKNFIISRGKKTVTNVKKKVGKLLSSKKSSNKSTGKEQDAVQTRKPTRIPSTPAKSVEDARNLLGRRGVKPRYFYKLLRLRYKEGGTFGLPHEIKKALMFFIKDVKAIPYSLSVNQGNECEVVIHDRRLDDLFVAAKELGVECFKTSFSQNINSNESREFLTNLLLRLSRTYDAVKYKCKDFKAFIRHIEFIYNENDANLLYQIFINETVGCAAEEQPPKL